MLIRKLAECKEFLAGDDTRLRELLHPSRGPVRIGYSLAHGFLDPGKRSKRHRLTSSEVYYFLSGRGVFHAGGEAAEVETGTTVYVPPGVEQWVDNTGAERVEFLCLVDPPWRAEDEEIGE
ncbi:cupin domain-containing protein [Candidatus Nitrospira bockiana]